MKNRLSIKLRQNNLLTEKKYDQLQSFAKNIGKIAQVKKQL